MLEINGIPPKLTNQVCEELLCQQYYYEGKLVQEVDILLLKINGRWHQLYFDAGVVFWRIKQGAPEPNVQEEGSPFSYPLLDIGEQYGLRDCTISEVLTEPLVEGVRVSLVFDEQGTLLITNSDNMTHMKFNMF